MKNFLNYVSLANISLGALSILLSFQGLFLYSAYLMAAAAVLDFAFISASGISKSTDIFSRDFNNISKTVSFSIAPAVFSYAVLFDGLEGYTSYLLMALPLALIISGVVRTARLNSGRITSWTGMRATFNVVLPLLYIFGFFSFYIVSGWLLLAPVMMLSGFNPRGSLKKKRNAKNVELKGSGETEDREEKEEETGLVPLNMFGD